MIVPIGCVLSATTTNKVLRACPRLGRLDKFFSVKSRSFLSVAGLQIKIIFTASHGAQEAVSSGKQTNYWTHDWRYDRPYSS